MAEDERTERKGPRPPLLVIDEPGAPTGWWEHSPWTAWLHEPFLRALPGGLLFVAAMVVFTIVFQAQIQGVAGLSELGSGLNPLFVFVAQCCLGWFAFSLVARALRRRQALRARAAFFETGVLVASVDSLTFLTRSRAFLRVPWWRLAGYRDDWEEFVQLIPAKSQGHMPTLDIPTATIEVRTELLAFLESHGVMRTP